MAVMFRLVVYLLLIHARRNQRTVSADTLHAEILGDALLDLVCMNSSVAVCTLVEPQGDEVFAVFATHDFQVFTVLWCFFRKELELKVTTLFALVVVLPNF